jgi:FkbM family methyltransferase
LILELDPSDFVDQSLYLSGLYEFGDYSEMIRATKTGDFAIDVGAHIGAYTLGLAKAVGTNGQVHAFEPNPVTFRRLQRNVELNSLGNLRLNQIAVSDSAGEAHLNSPTERNTSGATLVSEERVHGLPTQTYAVHTTTLDYYVETNGISHIDLLKIDAQGYDLRVLRGAENMIRRWRPRIMIEYDPYWLVRAQSSGSELLDYLRKLRYSVFEAKRGKLVPAIPPENNLVNLHCLPS